MVAKVGKVPSMGKDGMEAWLVATEEGEVLALFHMPPRSRREDIEAEAMDRVPEPQRITELVFSRR